MSKPVQKSGLGRGLSSLIPTKDNGTGNFGMANAISEINLSDIEANPFQPRLEFNPEALEELVSSIKIHGLIQPITVRATGNGKFELISGERRTRASRIVGLKTIPAYVRLANDQAMLEMALIENIHRENLNPIEIALSYQQLIEEVKLTQEQLAERVGKNRSTITNFLRLLKLPEEIQIALKSDKISTGHAKSLASIEDKETQLAIFSKVLEGELSVRETEKIIKDYSSQIKPKSLTIPKNKKEATSEYGDLELAKTTEIGSELKISASKSGKGSISIKFDNKEDLLRILALIGNH